MRCAWRSTTSQWPPQRAFRLTGWRDSFPTNRCEIKPFIVRSSGPGASLIAREAERTSCTSNWRHKELRRLFTRRNYASVKHRKISWASRTSPRLTSRRNLIQHVGCQRYIVACHWTVNTSIPKVLAGLGPWYPCCGRWTRLRRASTMLEVSPLLKLFKNQFHRRN